MSERVEYNRKYYERHKTVANKRSKEWYENNKEISKARARENYTQNKVRVKRQSKTWAQANKEKVQVANKKWAENNPEHFSEIIRRQTLRRSGWTLEQYNEAYAQQGGVCGICGEEVKSRSLDADHDHSTKARRGLLCNSCNMMLGFAKDRPTALEAAAAYLRKHGKV